MIKIDKKEVYSDENKFVHRLGTDTYFKRAIMLPDDTVADFAEMDTIPEVTDNNTGDNQL